MIDRQNVVARARGCLGVRFRPHGRDPMWGLDCVGVAAIAHARTALPAYALRSADRAQAEAALRVAGFAPAEPGGAGDLALIADRPTQLHLAVLTDGGFVHACARLGRVVETPGRPDGLLSCWRAVG